VRRPHGKGAGRFVQVHVSAQGGKGIGHFKSFGAAHNGDELLNQLKLKEITKNENNDEGGMA